MEINVQICTSKKTVDKLDENRVCLQFEGTFINRGPFFIMYYGNEVLYCSIKSPAYKLVIIKKMASPMYNENQMTFVLRLDE